MAIYSLANRTTVTTTGAANLEIIAASGVGFRLLEVGITINAATASAFGLGVPAAKGITPTSPVTVLAEDQNNTTAGNTQTALAWGTAPTVPAAFFRRVSLPATIGAGIIWTFPRGIMVPKNTSLVLWNLSAVAAADVWVVLDE
ncbi:hypothetical protein QM467_04815 [Rhodoblastus sp. 17X3]|uniref:hypothetical protein n=1 Tax=Rhodoblastus sp. 17X3 TaxID=3047026 RepID=UPI0024B63739|nr:hypothetical protein [Rhodoblastus sp. 17X3]MDI9847382.1 hypothetical protein [Rhodoblastus sp. 17X3]